MSEDKPNSIKNDEIDLIDLFNRIGKTFKRWGNSIGKAFLISIVFIIKRWLPLSISVVIGIVASYFSNIATVSTYSSDIVIRSNTVSNSDMIIFLNRLHDYCSAGNLKDLANKLTIPQKQIDEIIDIQAFWIIGNKSDRIPVYVDYSNRFTSADTSNVRLLDRIDIRVITKSLVNSDQIRDGIINFINSDPLFKQRNLFRLKQNQDFITRLETDILELDSLQKVKYFEETRSRQSQKGAQMIFLQDQKTQLFYDDISKLIERKQSYESSRNLYPDIVTILSDFSLPETNRAGGIFYGKNLVLIFFLFTLLLLIILGNRQKLVEIYKKY